MLSPSTDEGELLKMTASGTMEELRSDLQILLFALLKCCYGSVSPMVYSTEFDGPHCAR